MNRCISVFLFWLFHWKNCRLHAKKIFSLFNSLKSQWQPWSAGKQAWCLNMTNIKPNKAPSPRAAACSLLKTAGQWGGSQEPIHNVHNAHKHKHYLFLLWELWSHFCVFGYMREKVRERERKRRKKRRENIQHGLNWMKTVFMALNIYEWCG